MNSDFHDELHVAIERPIHLQGRLSEIVRGSPSLVSGAFGIWTAPVLISTIMAHGRSATAAGSLVMLQFLVLALVCLSIAPMVHRRNKRTLTFVGTSVAVIGYAALAWGPHGWVDALGLVLVGTGQGACFGAAGGIAAVSKAPDSTYGWMTVIAGIYGGLWLFVIPQVPLFLHNPDAALVYANMICVPATLMCPVARNQHHTQEVTENALKLLTPVSLVYLASVLLLYTAASVLWPFADQMGLALGLSPDNSGALLSATTVSGFMGTAAASLMTGRFSRQTAMSVGYLATALAFLGAFITKSLAIFAFCMLLQMAGQLFLVPIIFGIGTEMDERGRLATAASAMLLFGNAIGPGLAGVAIDYSDATTIGWGIFLMTVLSGLALSWVSHRLKFQK